MRVKALFPDRTVNFTTVKRIVSSMYDGDVRVSVLHKASGITVEMDLNVFYEYVEQLALQADVFGQRFDSKYLVMDSDLLNFTQVESGDITMKIWKQPRKALPVNRTVIKGKGGSKTH